ncbi:MAG: glycyl-radical enzyme activating protein [Candidatus Thorarchaeota archaeon]|nr:MAG: glycyl-radical enzyme activating protein [Candidatus Thorarchaeota archaeon]
MGMVLNIQRFSTEDGPGIRTTVFLKGCALRCKWCQNPESWTMTPQVVWYQNRCIGARHCLSACPEEALALTPKGMTIDRRRCSGCGDCAPVCPAKAIEVLGTRRSIDDVSAEVLRDRPFYEESRGGVTLSGGDPLFQFSFALALLTRFKAEGLHTALDTAGYGTLSRFRALVGQSDLVLYDLKIVEPEKHQRFTGVPVEPVLRNARWLGAQPNSVWIRTPIIPGFTDSPENIEAIAAFIRESIPTAERWDLLGFNRLCLPKWQRLDTPFECTETSLVSEQQMTQLVEIANESQVPKITWSGVTREAAAPDPIEHPYVGCDRR